MKDEKSTGLNLLRTGGAVAAVFSLLASLLIVFVIPGACSFVGGLMLLLLGFLFVTGLLTFGVGSFSLRRRSTAGAA